MEALQAHTPNLGEALPMRPEALEKVLPFGADLMIRTTPVEAPSSRSIIPTTSTERTTQGTVDSKGKTDTSYDSRERLDTTYD
jgi:hypothetical protein